MGCYYDLATSPTVIYKRRIQRVMLALNGRLAIDFNKNQDCAANYLYIQRLLRFAWHNSKRPFKSSSIFWTPVFDRILTNFLQAATNPLFHLNLPFKLLLNCTLQVLCLLWPCTALHWNTVAKINCPLQAQTCEGIATSCLLAAAAMSNSNSDHSDLLMPLLPTSSGDHTT